MPCSARDSDKRKEMAKGIQGGYSGELIRSVLRVVVVKPVSPVLDAFPIDVLAIDHGHLHHA